MRGKSVFLLQLCVNFVFPLQQVHTKFLHMWGLLCGLSIDVVDCCLKERVKAMEHVIVVEPEDMMSLVIQDNVEPVIEITITKIEDLKSSHSSQDFMFKVPQHVNRGNQSPQGWRGTHHRNFVLVKQNIFSLHTLDLVFLLSKSKEEGWSGLCSQLIRPHKEGWQIQISN